MAIVACEPWSLKEFNYFLCVAIIPCPADYKRERDNEGKEVKFNKVRQHPPVHKGRMDDK
jgi:hypothetical protein